jgi:hypothetical protein
MGYDSIDMVILRINMGYPVSLLDIYELWSLDRHVMTWRAMSAEPHRNGWSGGRGAVSCSPRHRDRQKLLTTSGGWHLSQVTRLNRPVQGLCEHCLQDPALKMKLGYKETLSVIQ